jgi:hypothetical protein
MNGTVTLPGKVAVAALAATALIFGATTSARSQEPVAPPQDAQKVLRENDRQRAAQAAVDAKVAAMRALPLANAHQARQSIQQVRPIFQRELQLLSSAAEPTPSQRREIAMEAGQTLMLNLRRLANNDAGLQPDRVFITNDPRKLVRRHLELAAWAKLSNVQSARYRDELERKAEDRREVVILNIVANIDKHLRLKPDQREKLCESFRTHWDDRDFPSLESSVIYDNYVPSIPDAYIAPILTDDQRKVWRGLQKYHFAAIRSLNPLDNTLAIVAEDDDLDDDVKAALAEEPKK